MRSNGYKPLLPALLLMSAGLQIGCATNASSREPSAATRVRAVDQPAATQKTFPDQRNSFDRRPVNRVTMPNGLTIEDLVIGEGRICLNPDSHVVVRFTGTLPDGRVFDTNVGDEPQVYPLGELIQGWREGIPGMRIGGTRRLLVPWQLGYGDQSIRTDRMTLPPQQDVVFEIELVDLK